MARSCFDGPLTEACVECEFWRDGSDGHSIGCAYPGPIMNCQAFAQMYNEEEKRRKENEEI